MAREVRPSRAVMVRGTGVIDCHPYVAFRRGDVARFRKGEDES